MPGLGATDCANLESQARAELGFSRWLVQPQRISWYPGFGGSGGYPVWYCEQQLQRFNAREAIDCWRRNTSRLPLCAGATCCQGRSYLPTTTRCTCPSTWPATRMHRSWSLQASLMQTWVRPQSGCRTSGEVSLPPSQCMRLHLDRYTHPVVVGAPSSQTSLSTRRAAGTKRRW